MAKPVAARSSFLPPLWVLTFLAAALLFWLLSELKEIVVLLVVGYSIAYLIDPLLEWLAARRVSRTAGFFVVCAGFLLLVALLAVTALPTIVSEGSDLLERFPAYFNTAKETARMRYHELLDHLPPELRNRLALTPDEIVPALGPDFMRRAVAAVTGTLLGGYSVTLTILNLALLPFIVFYLAVDLPYLHAAALSFFPRPYRKTVARLASQIDLHVSAFVRGQLLVGFILFLLYALGLGIIGVKLWVVIAFISGFGNLVPYLGTVVGIGFASVMALVTFGDFPHLLWTWGVYAIVQFLEGTFITPKVVGEKVGLSPLTVILAIFAAGKIFGLLGLFLAIPIAAVVRVMGTYAHGWVLKQVESNNGG